MRRMLAVIQFALVALLFISSQVSGQKHRDARLTCYTKYYDEETRTPESNDLVSFVYQKAETARSDTPDGQRCSEVGCVCYSYQADCSYTREESGQESPCTDTDRQNRVTKWHHGLTAQAQCEEMLRQPSRYQIVTCCDTNKCNNQPGTLTKIFDGKLPFQTHEIHTPQQNFQPSPSVQHPSPYDERQPQNPPQRYETDHQRSSPRYRRPTQKPSQYHQKHPTTTYLSEPHRPKQAQDSSLAPYNAASSTTVSKWIISSVVLGCFSTLVCFY